MPKRFSAQPRQTCCIKIPSATATARAPFVTLAGTTYNVNNERRSGDASFDAAWLFMNAAFFLPAHCPRPRDGAAALAHRGSAYAVIGSVLCRTILGTRRTKLQQNLRVIGRCDRLDDVEVAFFHRHFARSRVQRHDGAPHSIRHDAGVPCVQRVRGTRVPDAVGGRKRLSAQRPHSQHIIIKPRT
jgi:hypothetical protein